MSRGAFGEPRGRGSLFRARLFLAFFLAGLLSACSGDDPTRFGTSSPAAPQGLTVAEVGDGRVSLRWSAASGAEAYNVYYVKPGDASNVLFATTSSLSATVTGLQNNTAYDFGVTSVNSAGESPASPTVTATPAVPGDFRQSDLAGGMTWNFNILVAGASPGWMRGRLSVDDAGRVAFLDYLDSSGGTSPPADLFPKLFVTPTGQVLDSNRGTSDFQGVLSTSRSIVAGTSSYQAASPSLAVLQKHDPGFTFTLNDLKGFGQAGGGARRFVYNQLSSGPGAEWEFAEGQVGQDLTVQYPNVFLAPSNPTVPGTKVTVLSITADGVVTESRNPAKTPQPSVVVPAGTLSDDLSLLVATATDSTGANPRYVLRIYQVVNAVASDTNTFSATDLAGDYAVQGLSSGAAAVSFEGALRVDKSGEAAFTAYSDSTGATALPDGRSLRIDADGVLSSSDDTSFHGKLGYYKELLVWTRTDGSSSELLVGVK